MSLSQHRSHIASLDCVVKTVSKNLDSNLLSRRQTIDQVGQLMGRGLVSKDNRPMKCTITHYGIHGISNH